MKSPSRVKLEEEDKLGVNETFEARLRGCLSIYWMICEILDGSMDISDEKALNLLKSFKDKNDKCQEDIIELLKNSEIDRKFLIKNLEK